MKKTNCFKYGMWILMVGVLSFLPPITAKATPSDRDIDIMDALTQGQLSKDKEVQRKADEKAIRALQDELRRKVKIFNGVESSRLRAIFSHPVFAAEHWNSPQDLQEVINAATYRLDDSQKELLQERMQSIHNALNEIYSLSEATKLKVAAYNIDYPERTMTDDTAEIFRRFGLNIDADGVVRIPVELHGRTRFIPFKLAAEDIDAPSHPGHGPAKEPTKGKKAGSGWDLDGKDKDSDRDEDCEECNKKSPSGFATAMSYLLPTLGVVGTFWGAYENNKHKRDMLRTGERMMGQAAARGESPYTYMGLMQGAMNYDPFRFMGDSLTPAMMAITQLYATDSGYGKGKKGSADEFARYYDQRARSQRMAQILQMIKASKSTNVSSNTSTTQKLYIQQAVKSLNDMASTWNPGSLTDNARKQLQAMRQELSGGLSTRDRQDMYNAVSNLATAMQAQEQYYRGMNQVLDQIDTLWGQAGQMTQNQDSFIKGNGNITTQITRTVNDNSNRSGNGNVVGNMGGQPWQAGQAVFGGGNGGQRFSVNAGGGNNGFQFSGGVSNGLR
ncbi:MAG: hypothetical protein A3G92_07255 [Deltaproteobacteria bacterium RIFCSPLOWO2_12_FULL_38_8]|nr:MAG: hypothetical protein A3G92_07255 [Deltaproteobacteria bacterium RIFCSPLOWO2_12_FULL_38_8]